MSERYLFLSDWRPSNRRVFLAGLLGHYAAAYCFCAATMLGASLNDFHKQGFSIFAHANWSRAFEVAWSAPVVTAILGLYGAVIISPSLLITLPVTYLAARRLNVGALPAAAIGVAPGALVGLVVFGADPSLELFVLLSSAAGGIAFAMVVWAICIRPRRT